MGLFPFFKESSIRRWLIELEKDGWLVSTKEYNTTKYNHTKWYSLEQKYYDSLPQNVALEGQESNAQNEQSNVQNGQSVAQNERSTITDIKPDNKPTINPVEDDIATDKGTKAQRLAEFETFWKTYPIVRGTKPEKKRALRYWKVVVPNRISYQGILDKLTEDIKSEQWLKKDGQYIPAPCTYLNPDNERWTDELSPVVPIVHEPDPAMLEALDQTCLQNLREAETPPTLEQFEAANCEWYHESNRNKAIAYIKSYYAA
jgi:hypothetical protein